MMLGKLPPRNDPRTLRMAKYMGLPRIPVRVDWTKKVPSWPVMANDVLGDCTCAAAGHMIQSWTANATTMVTPLDKDIIVAYSAITGYNPADPRTDQGAVELDVLNYWRNTGIAGHKIMAYVAIDPKNRTHVKAALDLFGSVYLGLALPIVAQAQTGPNKTWRAVLGQDGQPGSWGGHAVPVVACDQLALECVTWGAIQRMSWTFLDKYCDEAYAVLSADWLNAKGSPSGFDLAALQRDLGLL